MSSGLSRNCSRDSFAVLTLVLLLYSGLQDWSDPEAMGPAYTDPPPAPAPPQGGGGPQIEDLRAAAHAIEHAGSEAARPRAKIAKCFALRRPFGPSEVGPLRSFAAGRTLRRSASAFGRLAQIAKVSVTFGAWLYQAQ
jgi:hypothetical protein